MESTTEAFEALVDIIAKLRHPENGCPWDLEQTHESLKPFLIEEAYEVLEAIDQGGEKLAEELGDVLLQVLLHSQIAMDEGGFDIGVVIKTLSEKLIERHPHVFGDASASSTDEVVQKWEEIKQDQRSEGSGLLDDLPLAFPALLRAQKIGVRTERVGFDWPDAGEVISKVREEMGEFIAELRGENHTPQAVREEFGDLLFTLVQLARKLGFDAEEALQHANRKFCKRYKQMEQQADISQLSDEEMDRLWKSIKEQE